MAKINGFLFMPDRWAGGYFENVDTGADLLRRLIVDPNEKVELVRTKIRTHNGDHGVKNFEGYVWHLTEGSMSATPYGFDVDYYNKNRLHLPAALKGRLFFEMDKETAESWKITTYLGYLQGISIIDEEGNDLKVPGVVYPADCPFKDQ